MPAFSDRRAAGRLLGERLKGHYAERVVVLALPRGGVPVAVEVAAALDTRADVLVTRKIGYPPQPELGVGAIAEGGEPFFDEWMLSRLGLSAGDLAPVVRRERAELDRQVRVYRGGRPQPRLAGKTAVIVDDGLATGGTARAALRAARAAGVTRTTLAVPVCPASTLAEMEAEADELVTLITPEDFRSVGEWYAAFGQLSDEDVLALLDGPRRLPPSPAGLASLSGRPLGSMAR